MGNTKPSADFSDSLKNRVDWWVSFSLKAMLVLGAILEIIQGNWLVAVATFGVALVAFIPILVDYRFRVRIPSEFEVLAVMFVYASLFLGNMQGFYEKFWWWDELLHTISGLILGVFGFVLVYVSNAYDNFEIDMKPSFVALFAFMFSLGMGTIWEIFEFSLDHFFGMKTQSGGLVDTMSDLIVDGIGALIISILGYSYLLTAEVDSFLERWIYRFISMNRRSLKFKKRIE